MGPVTFEEAIVSREFSFSGDSPHSCKICQRLVLDPGNAPTIHESWSPIPLGWKYLLARKPRPQKAIKVIRRFKYPADSESESYGIVFGLKLKEICLPSRSVSLWRSLSLSGSRCTFFAYIAHELMIQKTDEKTFRGFSLLALVTFDTVQFGFGIPDNPTELLSGLNFFQNPSRQRYRLLASIDNAAAEDIPTRPINIHPASPESFETSKRWLQTCLDTHACCLKPDGKFMPTRVIELVQVRGHTFLRLRETSGRAWEPYAALSYCWGKEQHLTTTSENLHRHLTRINMKDLPTTMRDAVLVIEKLGIRNVWIDALCILQDDMNDKAFEIAQMALVYSQATVTIAATRAGGVQEGFLGDRRPYPHGTLQTDSVIWELPYRSRAGATGSVILVPDCEIPTQPLDTRAWAFQERLLSPRILEYGSLQTRWKCQGTAELDDMTDGFTNTSASGKGNMKDSLVSSIRALMRPNGRDPSAPTSKQDILDLWHEVVDKYTHGNLTLSADRLPAIAGIAKQFGKLLEDQYRAGLWMSNLATELLWHVDNTETSHPKPIEYQAPSWSWAAITGPVCFFENVQIDPDFEVLDCQTTLQTDNARFSFVTSKYGPVEFGSLRVRGRLVEAELMASADFCLLKVKKEDGRYRSLYATKMRLDEAHEGSDILRHQIYLLRLSKPLVKGLVLRRNMGSGLSRLGFFECGPNLVEDENSEQLRSDEYQKDLACFESSELSTVTIV